MPKKLANINKYLVSDYYRYFGARPSILKIYFKGIFGINSSFAYNFWLRLASESGHPLYHCAKFFLKRYSIKFGIQIPSITKIGYGLNLTHHLGIIVNPKTQIGNNCNIGPFVTIGANHDKGATIGNNVYIGPSVCIVEDVKIGDNVTIGAGSVVVKDIPDNATVAGVPAKILSFDNPARYINRPII